MYLDDKINFLGIMFLISAILLIFTLKLIQKLKKSKLVYFLGVIAVIEFICVIVFGLMFKITNGVISR